jgi:hypothetical protein
MYLSIGDGMTIDAYSIYGFVFYEVKMADIAEDATVCVIV